MARFEPAEFEDMVPGSYDEAACSPPFDFTSVDDVGFKINGPTKVFAAFEGDGLAPDTVIPLCLGLKVPTAVVARHDDLFSRVAVVVADKRTGKAYTSNLAPVELTDPLPPADLPPDELEDSISTEYHTVDLAEYVTLPGAPAVYVVYATLEDYRSNTIEIELVAP